jgi:hypothetical protein
MERISAWVESMTVKCCPISKCTLDCDEDRFRSGAAEIGHDLQLCSLFFWSWDLTYAIAGFEWVQQEAFDAEGPGNLGPEATSGNMDRMCSRRLFQFRLQWR